MPLQLKHPSSPRSPFTFASPTPSPPAEDETHEPPTPPRPPADFLPERDMHMFGTYPLAGTSDAGRGLTRCRRCGKVVLEWAVAEHKRICAHVLDGTPLTTKRSTTTKDKLELNKKRRASEVSSSSPSPTKKRAKLPSEDPSVDLPLDPGLIHSYKGLKKSEIKKLHKERLRVEKRAAKERERVEIAERKRQRATCPVNLNRQCGVINDKNLPCSRSLTCKTHTVGAKRAVSGRTRSYDMLYLEWQRTNNPNFKEPSGKKVDPRSVVPRLRKRDEEDGVGDEAGLEELIALTRIVGEKLRPGVGAGAGGVRRGEGGVGAGAGAGGGGGGGGVWRSASWEFGVVGDMLTKALAARPKAGMPMSFAIPTGGAPSKEGVAGMGLGPGGFGAAPAGMYSVAA